ncbi:MAG: nicotinamide riboside transporter PnuC [Candidatus Planktophila sp.]|nr:nicotinamide riboside transporter PnuC [Candidatus Planktophila sp.]
MNIITWLFETNINFGSKSIPVREIIGGTLGLTSAILGMRRKVSAWPVGILGDALLFTVFLGAVFAYADQPAANFYGQASRNLLLIIVSIYGWIRWSQHRRNNGNTQPPVSPRWTTTREKLILVPTIIFFFFLSMQIFKALGESGTWLLVDTWIFTGTALATFGMSRGYVEFWLVWVAVDLVGVPFAFKNGYYPTGTLYAIYLPFVLWGFVSWLRISKLEALRVKR